jgi:Rrf2 family protein
MSKIFAISEAVSIAFHGMIMIAASEKKLNVGTIAEATGTSRHHVAKVCQRLVKSGLLYSTRGPNGGFVLKKKPAEISLMDIYQIIEGVSEEHKCHLGNQKCPFDHCMFGDVLDKLSQTFIDYLNNSTLDSLVKKVIK